MTTAVADSSGSFTFGSGTIVCAEAVLQGDIHFGSGTIVHPKAIILADAGPIIFGENNLVEETAAVINRQKSEDGKPVTLNIGSNNIFEIGSRCEASRVGDNNVVEVRAKVGDDVELSNGCVVGAGCELVNAELLPDNTVVYGADCRRRRGADKPQAQQGQMDYLRKALPNYHYLASKKA